MPFFALTAEISGVGTYRTMPAYLGLQWHHPNLVYATTAGKLKMVKKGFSHFWERLVSRATFKTRTSTKVTFVDRSQDEVVTLRYETSDGLEEAARAPAPPETR